MSKNIFSQFFKALMTDEWCRHDFETIEEWYVWKNVFGREHLTKSTDSLNMGYNLRGKLYHQRCIKCGEIVKVRIAEEDETK